MTSNGDSVNSNFVGSLPTLVDYKLVYDSWRLDDESDIEDVSFNKNFVYIFNYNIVRYSLCKCFELPQQVYFSHSSF